MEISEILKRQPWHFWAILILFITESIFAIRNHILLCNMPLADSLLVLCTVFLCNERQGACAGPLFQRICGCVAFCAVLFVNTTHALEMLTEFNDDKAPTNGNHTHEEGHAHEEDDHGHGGSIPATFIGVVVIDLTLKLFLLFRRQLPGFGMPGYLQLALHSIAPLAAIFLFTIDNVFDLTGNYFIEHLDPMVAIVLSLLSIALIVPSFREMKPYVFADTPQCFDSENFSNEISEQFEGVHCTHIHVYRIWPKSRFEALIHINIEVDKSRQLWSQGASARYNDISKYIRSALTKGGADKVVIEPRFLDSSHEDPEWMGCVGASCFVEDRGCCSQLTARGERPEA